MFGVYRTTEPFEAVVEVVVDLDIINFGARTDTLEGNAVQFVRIGQACTSILNAGVEDLTGVIVGSCTTEQAGGTFA